MEVQREWVCVRCGYTGILIVADQIYNQNAG